MKPPIPSPASGALSGPSPNIILASRLLGPIHPAAPALAGPARRRRNLFRLKGRAGTEILLASAGPTSAIPSCAALQKGGTSRKPVLRRRPTYTWTAGRLILGMLFIRSYRRCKKPGQAASVPFHPPHSCLCGCLPPGYSMFTWLQVCLGGGPAGGAKRCNTPQSGSLARTKPGLDCRPPLGSCLGRRIRAARSLSTAKSASGPTGWPRGDP